MKMKKLAGTEILLTLATTWKSLIAAVFHVAMASGCTSKEDGTAGTEERQPGPSESSSHGQSEQTMEPEPQTLVKAKKLLSQGLCAQALPKLVEELADNVEDYRFHNTICQSYLCAVANKQPLQPSPDEQTVLRFCEGGTKTGHASASVHYALGLHLYGQKAKSRMVLTDAKDKFPDSTALEWFAHYGFFGEGWEGDERREGVRIDYEDLGPLVGSVAPILTKEIDETVAIVRRAGAQVFVPASSSPESVLQPFSKLRLQYMKDGRVGFKDAFNEHWARETGWGLVRVEKTEQKSRRHGDRVLPLENRGKGRRIPGFKYDGKFHGIDVELAEDLIFRKRPHQSDWGAVRADCEKHRYDDKAIVQCKASRDLRIRPGPLKRIGYPVPSKTLRGYCNGSGKTYTWGVGSGSCRSMYQQVEFEVRDSPIREVAAEQVWVFSSQYQAKSVQEAVEQFSEWDDRAFDAVLSGQLLSGMPEVLLKLVELQWKSASFAEGKLVVRWENELASATSVDGRVPFPRSELFPSDVRVMPKPVRPKSATVSLATETTPPAVAQEKGGEEDANQRTEDHASTSPRQDRTRYPLHRLTVRLIMSGAKGGEALMATPDGSVFILKLHDQVGTAGGVVTGISKDRLQLSFPGTRATATMGVQPSGQLALQDVRSDVSTSCKVVSARHCFIRANLYRETGAAKQALSEAQAGHQKSPRDLKLLLLLAELSRSRGQMNSTIAYLEQANRLAPANEAIVVDLAGLFARLKDPSNANRVIREAIPNVSDTTQPERLLQALERGQAPEDGLLLSLRSEISNLRLEPDYGTPLRYETETTQCGQGVWGISSDGTRAVLCIDGSTPEDHADPDVLVDRYSVVVVDLETGGIAKEFPRVFHSEIPRGRGAAFDAADENMLERLNRYLKQHRFVESKESDADTRKKIKRGQQRVPAFDTVALNHPIWGVLKEGNVTELSELLEREPGAVGVRNQDHWTPLHYAAAVGAQKPLELLLKYGASPQSLTYLYNTPAKLAETRGHKRIVNTLTQYVTSERQHSPQNHRAQGLETERSGRPNVAGQPTLMAFPLDAPPKELRTLLKSIALPGRSDRREKRFERVREALDYGPQLLPYLAQLMFAPPGHPGISYMQEAAERRGMPAWQWRLSGRLAEVLQQLRLKGALPWHLAGLRRNFVEVEPGERDLDRWHENNRKWKEAHVMGLAQGMDAEIVEEVLCSLHVETVNFDARQPLAMSLALAFIPPATEALFWLLEHGYDQYAARCGSGLPVSRNGGPIFYYISALAVGVGARDVERWDELVAKPDSWLGRVDGHEKLLEVLELQQFQVLIDVPRCCREQLVCYLAVLVGQSGSGDGCVFDPTAIEVENEAMREFVTTVAQAKAALVLGGSKLSSSEAATVLASFSNALMNPPSFRNGVLEVVSVLFLGFERMSRSHPEETRDALGELEARLQKKHGAGCSYGHRVSQLRIALGTRRSVQPVQHLDSEGKRLLEQMREGEWRVSPEGGELDVNDILKQETKQK